MSLENMIVDTVENLLLTTDGSVFAVYHVPSFIMSPVDFKRREKAKQAVEDCLAGLKPYHDFDIMTLPYPKDLDGIIAKLLPQLSPDTKAVAVEVLEEAYQYLMTHKELCEDTDFLVVPLKSYHVSIDLKETVKSSVNAAGRFAAEVLGRVTDVYEGWEESYLAQREALEKKLKILDASRVIGSDLLYFNRFFYTFMPNIDKVTELSLLENNLEHIGATAWNMDDKDINILALSVQGQTQFVTYLPIAYQPENMSYVHLAEKVKQLGFPVATLTKVKFSKTKGTPNNNVRFKARFARGRLKNTQEEAYEADSVGKQTVAESKFLVEDMERKVDNGVPMLSYLQVFVLFDWDKEVLRQKVAIVMAAMKDIKVKLSRATPYQLYLFGKMRPGKTLDSSDKNFIQVTELPAFCEDMFFTKQKVGQDVGFYIGMIDNQTGSWHSRFGEAIEASNKPVFINLFEAVHDVDGKDSSNPHIQVSGDTGSGKTFLVSYLHFYSSLFLSQTLYIDPKREKRYWYGKVLKELEDSNSYPEVQAYIRSLHFVTLDHTDKANHGVLDPLVFLDVSQAKDLIYSMINEFINLDNEKKFRTALSKAVELFSYKRKQGEKVGTLSVFEYLSQDENESVSDMADLLKEEVRNSVLSLVFSDGQNDAVDLTARNTILEIAGLDLPSTENASLSLQNRKSLAVIYALGHFIIQFGERDYSRYTLEVFDEAWVLNTTAYGRGLVDRIKRVGRSQKNFLIFTSQEPDDANNSNDEATAFGTYFCFYNDGDQKIDNILKRLKVEINDESREWASNITKAQCLMKDTYGRVERLTVHGFYEPLNRLFATVREEEDKKEESVAV